MGGMGWEQAQLQKAQFERMEREGKKVIVWDPKEDFGSNVLTLGKAGEGKTIRCVREDDGK